MTLLISPYWNVNKLATLAKIAAAYTFNLSILECKSMGGDAVETVGIHF